MELVSALMRLRADGSDLAAWATVVDFCSRHWEIPAALTVAYLAVVYATRNTIPAHPFAGAVDRCFAAWNLSLSLFSCWGFWHMSGAVHAALRAEGLFFTVCSDTMSVRTYFGRGPAALALALFCLSKVPELGDTVFLILKRRPVRLLQWYHHATVMLFCWLALATEYTPGIWFAVTNYFVHAIMYLYFFLMTFKGVQRAIKPIAPAITIIQISQMVWGLAVNGIAIWSYLATGECQIRAVTVYCAILMYASYFWLFSRLFLDSRAGPAPRKGGGVAKSTKTAHHLVSESSSAEQLRCSKKVR